jgi:FKBP-type peptidyl-prolyl cis-trans isomerase FkpA
MSTKQTASGLGIDEIIIGEGVAATAGKSVTVHYTGWLTDGTKFDSSKDRNDPFVFGLGQGQVIRGWDEGVQGMKVGGKRELTIPPALGYGARGAGGVIPPNATCRMEFGARQLKIARLVRRSNSTIRYTSDQAFQIGCNGSFTSIGV